MTGNEHPLPLSDRDDEHVRGHWLLARLGKRVLLPGGIELTRTLLVRAEVAGADVLELAPGLGRTAAEIIARRPRSYVGAEADPAAANLLRGVVSGHAGHAEVKVTDAAETGLADASVDVVIGEGMLTMQSDAAKHAIVAEAARVLRPRGRYAIHELALTPDDLPAEVATDIRQSLARVMEFNARPLDRRRMVGAVDRSWACCRTRRHGTDGAVAAATGAGRRRPAGRAALWEEHAHPARFTQAGAGDAQRLPATPGAVDRRRDRRGQTVIRAGAA